MKGNMKPQSSVGAFRKEGRTIKMSKLAMAFGICIIAFLISACNGPEPAPATLGATNAVSYTCPMHPQILEDHPGSCPVCGMALVKKSGLASRDAAISLNTVLEPVNSSVISTVKAIAPGQREIADNILADGYLDFDTRTYNNISARFSGRIEKVYIKYAYQDIHQGQRILDIYSPDMVTAQQDLLYIIKNSPLETGLINAAKQKLLLQGMTNSQVSQIIKSRKPFYSLPVYSAYDGHVHDMPHTQMAGGTDQKAATDFTTNLPLTIKEGMYVEKGQTLFNVVNPHKLWAIIKINAAGIGAVKLNQPVKITVPDLPGRTLFARVNFIEPVLQNGDKTMSIRVYLNNMDHSLKVNSLVRAEIGAGQTSGLWIPRSALVDLGQTQVVWLKNGAVYRVHKVTTGLVSGTQIQIKTGLSIADSVAANARYLTDSESFIKTQSHE